MWGGLQAMLDCDVPMVAQIEGNCMGAGLEIASCCDIRIAGDSAKFGAPIAKLGFPMAPREAALVMRAAGELTAREMLLSAAVLDAGEMKRRGFLNQVVPAQEASATAMACVERCAGLAPGAARQNKQALRTLAQAGSSKERILSVQIFLTDIGKIGEMNAVWDKWVAKGHSPARATVEAKLASPGYAIEITAVAAKG